MLGLRPVAFEKENGSALKSTRKRATSSSAKPKGLGVRKVEIYGENSTASAVKGKGLSARKGGGLRRFGSDLSGLKNKSHVPSTGKGKDGGGGKKKTPGLSARSSQQAPKTSGPKLKSTSLLPVFEQEAETKRGDAGKVAVAVATEEPKSAGPAPTTVEDIEHIIGGCYYQNDEPDADIDFDVDGMVEAIKVLSVPDSTKPAVRLGWGAGLKTKKKKKSKKKKESALAAAVEGEQAAAAAVGSAEEKDSERADGTDASTAVAVGAGKDVDVWGNDDDDDDFGLSLCDDSDDDFGF